MIFHEYPDAELMMMDLADTLASELKSCLLTHESATFCVPGGTTPGPIFDTLSAVHLEWDRVTVIPSDERWVPEQHDRSNAKLIRSRLLKAQAQAASFVSFSGSGDLEAALPDFIQALDGHLPISVLLLGMGPDMHTASLFPGSDRLEEALAPQAAPLVAITAPGQPELRVTLSARILREALATHIVITGSEKCAALETARHLPELDAPVRAVLSGAQVHWAP